ncbi:hypothetical protein DDV93_20315 [Cereibacter johrii]|nr:hypothetical protein DDV93_20315 [Cereibacter johrii]
MSKMRYLRASFWLPDLLDLDAPTMPDLRKMSEMEEGSLQPRPVEWVTTPPRFTIDASDDDALSS